MVTSNLQAWTRSPVSNWPQLMTFFRTGNILLTLPLRRDHDANGPFFFCSHIQCNQWHATNSRQTNDRYHRVSLPNAWDSQQMPARLILFWAHNNFYTSLSPVRLYTWMRETFQIPWSWLWCCCILTANFRTQSHAWYISKMIWMHWESKHRLALQLADM